MSYGPQYMKFLFDPSPREKVPLPWAPPDRRTTAREKAMEVRWVYLSVPDARLDMSVEYVDFHLHSIESYEMGYNRDKHKMSSTQSQALDECRSQYLT